MPSKSENDYKRLPVRFPSVEGDYFFTLQTSSARFYIRTQKKKDIT